jgi:hypothetical protein
VSDNDTESDTMSELKFKKADTAGRSHGRGSDNHYQPAKYDIMDGDEKVGFCYGSKAGQYERIVWEVCMMEDGVLRPVKTIFRGGLKKAKEWVAENYGE